MKKHPGLILRTVRTEQQLTLRDLAARAGMPYSTLSKLENGKMAMTYDKLVCLAQALGVEVGRLVGDVEVTEAPPPALGRRSVARADASINAISDRYAHQYMAADLLGKLMIPIIIEVKAGSVDELGGLFRHAGEEYLYILKGAMELHSDLYAPLTLEQGDSVYFDSGMAHGYVRIGTEPCQVLAICAGAGIQGLVRSAGRTFNLLPPDHSGTVVVSDIET